MALQQKRSNVWVRRFWIVAGALVIALILSGYYGQLTSGKMPWGTMLMVIAVGLIITAAGLATGGNSHARGPADPVDPTAHQR